VNRYSTMPLAGKSIVVTGAGNGLGRAYAEHAARSGAEVVVNDIDEAAADEVVRSIRNSGGQAIAAVASVSDWGQSESIVRACVEHFGKIDGLINNAGVLTVGLPWEVSEKDIRQTLEVDLLGAIFVGRAALKAMRESGGGAILNVTSGAQSGRPLMGVYGASRAGTAALTYSWAIDCQPFGIRVNAIWPLAGTNFFRKYEETLFTSRGRKAPEVSPSMSAPLATFLLSDASAGITGQVVAIRQTKLGIMSHPSWTEHVSERAEGWQFETIQEAFEESLHAGVQPVGAVD
jgi:NAD(P)-dependent dehydrogenase (short-subunit alcohol dehydrogenase family)